jgi:hypothetical protein
MELKFFHGYANMQVLARAMEFQDVITREGQELFTQQQIGDVIGGFDL